MTDRSVPTCQDALRAIEKIAGDDFCEYLDMLRHKYAEASPDTSLTLIRDLDQAIDKILLIYKISHSMNTSTICYADHADWRELIKKD